MKCGDAELIAKVDSLVGMMQPSINSEENKVSDLIH